MKLTVVGSSPAWPNPGEAHSGYLIEGSGRMLLDCGPGVLARLRVREGWPRVDAIVISHLHLDHFGDLVPWIWGTMAGPGAGNEPPRLLVPPGSRASLAQLSLLISSREDIFEHAFRLFEYQPGQPEGAAGFELIPWELSHYTKQAYGFRISDGTSTLAYSGDCGPSQSLVDLARSCDLFLCEATLADGEAGPRGHLSLAEAEEAFHASGARRLLVTHRPSELPLTPGIQRAEEGLELEF